MRLPDRTGHARRATAGRESGVRGGVDSPSPSNPDGDVELADEHVARFRLVGCECCGSDLLKPDVVFFGENVPRPRVDRCYELVTAGASLLVLGSSLTVMSGLRFVQRAHRDGLRWRSSTAG